MSDLKQPNACPECRGKRWRDYEGTGKALLHLPCKSCHWQWWDKWGSRSGLDIPQEEWPDHPGEEGNRTIELLRQECRLLRKRGDALAAACVVPAEPEQAGKAQGWIPVEERLPPKGEFVLAYAPARGVDLAHLENGSHGESVWFWSFQGYGILSEVTHWMPLPAPPTKDTTNG